MFKSLFWKPFWKPLSVWQAVDGNGVFLVQCLSASQVCLHSSRREWVITHRIDMLKFNFLFCSCITIKQNSVSWDIFFTEIHSSLRLYVFNSIFFHHRTYWTYFWPIANINMTLMLLLQTLIESTCRTNMQQRYQGKFCTPWNFEVLIVCHILHPFWRSSLASLSIFSCLLCLG